MEIKEAIERYTSNAEYERSHGSLQGCLEFRQLAEWLKDYKRLLEREPCREIEDYENEIEDLHNRLDIAEYDKERLREEVTNLEEKIKALEQEPKTKWIPCSERLPEETGTYIATFDYEEHGLAVGQRYYHGDQIGWDDKYVIAWMPLPEPYKTESEVSE